MTICYHMENCKLSHPRSNDLMIKWLRQVYEIILKDRSSNMMLSRGKFHKYLGMTLDYTVRGQIQIIMIDFLDKVLTDFDKA